MYREGLAPERRPRMSDPGMFTQEDMAVLLPLFQGSGAEYVAAIRQAVRSLESGPADDEALAAMHRAAHSVKGAALQLGFVHIGTIARAMEALAAAARGRTDAPASGWLPLITCGADRLERDLRALTASGPCPEPDGELLRELQAAAARLESGDAAAGGRNAR
jgi:chemotaxis protein histidine kinase CheA